MACRDPNGAIRHLYSLGTSQGGYFTAKQSAGAGYGKQHLNYHAKVGNFERVGRGLYRLPTIPVSENDDLIRLFFWSRNREYIAQAVVSHNSAF